MRNRLRTRLAQQPLVLATLFYALGLLLPALVLRAVWFGEWLYLDDLGLPSPMALLVAAGGTVLLLVGTPWIMRFDWAKQIADVIVRVFHPLTVARATWLGALSGFCEELLFQGALQPMIGLLAASLLFALVHCVRGWWLFALVIGLALGALYTWSGNLWPCVLAHALLNAVNLYRLSRFTQP